MPYQLLSTGRIAIRTDLPAGARRQWNLVDGAPAAEFAESVQVRKSETYYEVTNGQIGVRIPLPVSDAATTPAPVQAIRYLDGTWTATGPNHLSVNARRMDVRFLEQGPLKVVVEVSYVMDRPALLEGEKVVIPAGEGFYKSLIQVQAGQQSILFEEQADTDVAYSLNFYAGLAPTQARYRGHGSTDVRYGRTAGGQPYPGGGISDGLVDLAYDRPKSSGDVASETSWPRISPWNPWAKNGGWYWMLYNEAAPETANLLGIFAGRASRTVGASHSGVGIFTEPKDGGERTAGVTITLARRGSDRRVFAQMRFAWGLFIGSKGKDLLPTEEVRAIARSMCSTATTYLR